MWLYWKSVSTRTQRQASFPEDLIRYAIGMTHCERVWLICTAFIANCIKISISYRAVLYWYLIYTMQSKKSTIRLFSPAGDSSAPPHLLLLIAQRIIPIFYVFNYSYNFTDLKFLQRIVTSKIKMDAFLWRHFSELIA